MNEPGTSNNPLKFYSDFNMHVVYSMSCCIKIIKYGFLRNNMIVVYPVFFIKAFKEHHFHELGVRGLNFTAQQKKASPCVS